MRVYTHSRQRSHVFPENGPYFSCERTLFFLQRSPFIPAKEPCVFWTYALPFMRPNLSCKRALHLYAPQTHNALQRSATPCSTLQHTATHCSTLQDSTPDYTDVCVQHPQDCLLSRTQAPKTWRTLSQATASHGAHSHSHGAHCQNMAHTVTGNRKSWRTLSQATASDVSCVQHPQHTGRRCNTPQHCNGAHCHRQPQIKWHKYNVCNIL